MLSELNPVQIDYIFMNMEDAVCLTGMNGDLIYANPAAERLFGLDVRSRSKIWDAIPYIEGNDALIQLFIDGVMEKKQSKHSLVDYVNNKGTLFNLHVTLTCESEDSGMILIVIHDLTDLTKIHHAFERYTSPEIADYVLTAPGGEKQGGETREATILMSDLRGFTALSTRLSSDQLIVLLNHYFECMSAVIARHGGTVIEFLGDGIFVVFGAPRRMPDHAAEAVACAVGMQNAMAEVNAWNREHGFPDLSMGIGVNSGSVVVGNIGSDRKMKYGCMGEPVNLAGRLESLTMGGDIMISENTRKLITEDLTIIAESSFMPKGARNSMKYCVVGGIGETVLQQDAAGSMVEWRKLPAARKTVFCLLDGKAVDPEEHEGLLTDVSADERFGILSAGFELQPMQNLMLRLGGENVYAKVLQPVENGYRIVFTSTPVHFSALLG